MTAISSTNNHYLNHPANQPPQDSSPIEKLPKEIFNEVLGYVKAAPENASDLLNARLVNKQWREIVDNNQIGVTEELKECIEQHGILSKHLYKRNCHLMLKKICLKTADYLYRCTNLGRETTWKFYPITAGLLIIGPIFLISQLVEDVAHFILANISSHKADKASNWDYLKQFGWSIIDTSMSLNFMLVAPLMFTIYFLVDSIFKLINGRAPVQELLGPTYSLASTNQFLPFFQYYSSLFPSFYKEAERDKVVQQCFQSFLLNYNQPLENKLDRPLLIMHDMRLREWELKYKDREFPFLERFASLSDVFNKPQKIYLELDYRDRIELTPKEISLLRYIAVQCK